MGHGATDGRYFANNGMRVIVHQGTGGGIQGEAEWVDINSLYQLIEVQSEFIKRLAIKNL
jgi:acetylornithine deacetylase/succinyl-diaminopimelate desuccinylase-like protein